uniref:Amino acid adenylation domain-containing protein/thioester reductase domain-containing protein n=1 Tax=Candidatus Kentrum sp. TC TaxID=2126339 RepID=A0A450YJF1_9GAMM|nr:MAG: amino acid adenylation domain-containing protein/thioester reductase domain-containing protein [Candidatus Kentron sp. TC]
MGIFVREWKEAYGAFSRGETPNVPPLPFQYSDYAAWQRQWLRDEVLEEQLAYWKDNLAGIPELLELPTDHPRPAQQSYRGTHRFQTLPCDVTAAIEAFSREQGVTLFMTLLAAFDVLLARYSGQDDICVGSPIANRTRTDMEGLIGFFVNTLVLRARLNPDWSFRELLGEVRRVCLGAYAHQDIPFEALVERLNPARSLSHGPLFQVMLVLQNNEPVAFELPELAVSTLEQDYPVAKFDLTLSIEERNDQLHCTWEYASELFTADTIRRMGEHFEVLLRGILENPEQPISRLPLLTEAEKQRILVEWNETKTPYPADKCVHELFEDRVAKTPDAVAVIFEGREISYGELNTRANRLANRLLALGIGPEVPVGLFMERSVEMIVGLLAILKAGGAYVPLDLKYPAERLAFIVEDADLKVLLCHEATREKLPKCAARILDVDEEAAAIAGESAENPARLANPNNLAYVIYTSGSTGKPKGVMIEHRGLANLAWAQARAFRITSEDRVLQFASLNFDASLEQIFSALLGGAGLVLRGPEVWTVEECLRQARRSDVTIADLPPVYLYQFLEFCLNNRTPSSSFPIRQFVTGGEALGAATVRLCRELGIPLVNAYGPTEATITATNFHLSDEEVPGPTVPIGNSIANTQVYVLDNHMDPVPIGVSGELYIGGAGVARGYLNRPELTSEKFIPDPFGDDPDARLYRTGDLCRWLPDGTIEYLGRIDTQVKIRGFRIECGEVENALLLHPDVREAVVDARGEGADKRLAAWVVGDVGAIHESPLRDELRTHLRGMLPDWMVPSIFVFVESLPLTPSGKIDRRALPAPDEEDVGSVTEYTAPRTETEIEMAALWSKALGVEKVGLHNDFFDLGGHSLLAVKLISQVKEQFCVDVPMRALFEEPTVSGILKGMGLARTGAEKKELDLDGEAWLEDDIRPQPETLDVSRVKNPGRVLVTGATGFLGIYLVGELLRRTRAVIWCFVRGKNQQEAENRLEAALIEHDQAMDGWRQRVKVVKGDLKQARLGLTEELFQELTDKIDVIYHNGAEVNHVYPYRELRKANVEGTKEILRLACAGRGKPVHYVSTIGVLAGEMKNIQEDSELNADGLIDNGYVRSKWVAEKLVWEAGNRGLPVAVYRPDRIGGHSETGKWNDTDALYRMLKATIGKGISPDWRYMENVAPVDYCARALAWLSLRKQTLGNAYHLTNPNLVAWGEIMEHLRANGLDIREVSYEEWRAEVGDSDEGVLGHWLDQVVGEDDSSSKDDSAPTFGYGQTMRALRESGIECPRITREIIDRYVKAMQRKRK